MPQPLTDSEVLYPLANAELYRQTMHVLQRTSTCGAVAWTHGGPLAVDATSRVRLVGSFMMVVDGQQIMIPVRKL